VSPASFKPVAAIGVGQTAFRRTSESATYVELLHESATRALESCGLTIDDIDAIVLALAPEALMGVNHAERWCVEYIGGRFKPVMRIQTGGATGLSAIQAGFYHIASGLYDRVLVVGADRVAESGDAQQVFNKIWDPFYERDLPFTTITMIAMSAVRYMHRYGMTERQMARVSVKAHRNGALNPHAHIRREVTIDEVLASRYLAWPLKLLDACPQSAGGRAVVLASQGAVDASVATPAWISGISMAGETYNIGDRLTPSERGLDYADAEALVVAAETAYAMAGIDDPRSQIDVVETYASFTSVEIHNAEALGLANFGEA
jgi:acetyl-CoA C-acetyltransferase